jgi:hypothetical protein
LPIVAELAAAVHVVSRVRRADSCPRIGKPERAGRAAPAIADIGAEVEPGPVIDGIGEGAGRGDGEIASANLFMENTTKIRLRENRPRLSDSYANDVTRRQQPRGLDEHPGDESDACYS